MKTTLPFLALGLISAAAQAQVNIQINAPAQGDVYVPAQGAVHYPSQAPALNRGSYNGLQYNWMRYDHRQMRTANPGAVTFISGYQFDDYFSLEGRIGTNVDSDHNAKLTYHAGAFLKGGWANPTPFTPYVLLGVTNGRFSASGYGSGTQTDFSYGGGVSLSSSRYFSLNLEYVSYFSDDQFDLSSFNAGFNFRF
ncbi:outer membrane beta-barrel protein [Ferrimonas pelagia]|uniref:Outer membrane protein beta-barrel domain-containing protein n=1 Tax=Ferrimonas pelagia TaxID=1177826 RepID=A0ABP9EEX1_9GAMM